MLKFNKKKRTLKSGKVEKQPSYMMAIPKKKNAIENMEYIIERLEESNLFILENFEDIKNTSLTFNVFYKGESYRVNILLENYELGELCKLKHYIKEEDYKSIIKNNIGITTSIIFGDNILDSYHLQIKLLYTIMPDMAGVMDFATGRILSAKWTELCAKSLVAPSTDYIYSIQTINDNNVYWLYTQGLNRCGFIDIEILKSTSKTFKIHKRILKIIAQKIVLTNSFIDEEEVFSVGKMNNGNELLITWINPDEAVKLYSRDIPGGIEEREELYKEDTGVIYIYINKSKYEKRSYSHISVIDKFIKKGIVVLLTNEEIIRNSKLAMERLNYFIKGFNKHNSRGLVEIGIEIEEYTTERGINREHLWFNIKEIDKVSAVGILSNQPYYRKDLIVGTELEFLVEHLTDWVLYIDNRKIVPDNVYILEEI